MAKISINMKSGEVADDGIAIGIDLGTTNSLVAYMEDGMPQVVSNSDGSKALVPSVIHFTKEGKVIVGDEAKTRLISDPERTIYSVKRLIGKSYKDLNAAQLNLGYELIEEDAEIIKVKVGAEVHNPIELSAQILKYLKTKIETSLNKRISKAVITVPAYFNDAQRQATRDAGKLAGLDILRIINEPTAAALAYGYDTQEPHQIIAVYDLGGGTFDFTLLSLSDGIYEVLATNGDTELGGDDIDQLITDHWLTSLKLPSDTITKDKQFAQSLRIKSEIAKKTLSIKEEYSDVSLGTLSRTKFNQLISPLVNKTISLVKRALKDAEIEVGDIDKIITVGGSTRIPFIKDQLASMFGQTVFDKLDPDKVVAMGAAIQADMLNSKSNDSLLLDVTPLSLGIETTGGLMDVIIPRNSKVPASKGREYTTSVDGQKNVKLSVYQGERDLVEHNRKLGEFILANLPPMAAGIPKLEVQFHINADGILNVKATEKRSGQNTEIEIQSQYGITEQEMGKMLLDSIQHAEEDMHAKSLREAQVEAKSLVDATSKFIQQNEEHLSQEEQSQLTTLSSALLVEIDVGDKDSIRLKMDSLNKYSAPIAHKMMDINIKLAMHGKTIS